MAEKITVLLVDDEKDFRETLKKELSHMGFLVTLAASGEEALQITAKEIFDVVLLDIRMPGTDGIQTLKSIKELSPTAEVIMLTGYGTMASAIESMKLGAYDFLTKPCALAEIEATIKKAYEKKILAQQNIVLKRELARKDKFPDFIGNSSKLKSVLEIIDKVAETDSTVLIQGESGVGKELVAKAIHRNSLRSKGPFVVVDCGSLHENLLQSELFGHERGAYTGAVSLKHGLFEVADSGTLFMDEIGQISPAIQANLLRVLETGSFRRVGGTENIKVDVRIIAATNQDLRKSMENGNFRGDLFYRLNVVSIVIPPLRERKEDIPLLAKYFIEHTRVTGRAPKKLSDEALEILMNYHWPGNIRELQNIIERAIILSEGEYITREDLPMSLKEPTYLFTTKDTHTFPSLEEIELQYIQWVLKETGGNRKRAAQILKIDPKTLYRRLLKSNKKRA